MPNRCKVSIWTTDGLVYWYICVPLGELTNKCECDSQHENSIFLSPNQAAILKMTLLKINRLLPMATINMHMKIEIEILKQTWLMLRKPCRLEMDGRTNGRLQWNWLHHRKWRTDGQGKWQTDGQGKSNTPPPPLQLRWAGVWIEK